MFGKPLLTIWERKMDPGFQQHRLIRFALKASVGLEDILDEHASDFRLMGEVASTFKDLCYQMVACVSALGQYYHPKNIWLFHVTIKAHYILHLGNSCGQLNPRLGWCYRGEDMMGKVKRLVQSCCRGSCPQRIVVKVMQKYMYGLALVLMDSDRMWK